MADIIGLFLPFLLKWPYYVLHKYRAYRAYFKN